MTQRLRAVGLCSSDLSSQAIQALAALALAVVSRQAQTIHSPKQALALSQNQQAVSEQHLVRPSRAVRIQAPRLASVLLLGSCYSEQ